MATLKVYSDRIIQNVKKSIRIWVRKILNGLLLQKC